LTNLATDSVMIILIGLDLANDYIILYSIIFE